ncbi:MAG TPA: class I SAM-dependent methyltransferase [Gemmataceae bacterium]|nr:class I SAM-dependent methyltransferase [Gemmataceae bacterium]
MQTARASSNDRYGERVPVRSPKLPEGLSCPNCRGAVQGYERVARCGDCGRAFAILGGRIADFLAEDHPGVDAIFAWSDGFVRNAEPWLLALASGKSVSAAASLELQAQQLVAGATGIRGEPGGSRSWRCDGGSRLTALGSNLAYHCAEFSLQSAQRSASPFWERFLRRSALGAEAAVLDVGCGAGQTLRLLERYHPAERIGLDIDREALAFGCRLAEAHGEAISFVRASAYRIPFRDQRFTHVICRVALNYVHQWRALTEMVRVLQPGGYLYCSVEGPGFDLHFLRQARTAAQVASRLRDLFYGWILAVTGMQPAPGSRLTGGRASGTFRRCTQTLNRTGCDVVYAETISRYLGLPLTFDVVARKR